jgi:hypothetical protein
MPSLWSLALGQNLVQKWLSLLYCLSNLHLQLPLWKPTHLPFEWLFPQLVEAFSRGILLFRLRVLLDIQQRIGILWLVLLQRMLRFLAKSMFLSLESFSTVFSSVVWD